MKKETQLIYIYHMVLTFGVFLCICLHGVVVWCCVAFLYTPCVFMLPRRLLLYCTYDVTIMLRSTNAIINPLLTMG